MCSLQGVNPSFRYAYNGARTGYVNGGMMKGLKYLFIVLGILVALFVGVGLSLPKTSFVERSVVVDAKPEVIYGLISNHEKSLSWSPWAAKDPNMSVRYENGKEGLDATMHWKSDNRDVGNGSSTFIEVDENQRVKLALDFGEMMTSTAELNLSDAEDGGTKVRWSLDVQHTSLISRYFGLLMEGIVAPDFDKGLARLKSVAEAAPNIKTEVLTYTLDGTEFSGFLAYPDNGKKNPSVILVHEWWGHNDYVRTRAKMLAELGYTAFALDMYGDGKLASHPDDAKAFMNEVIQQQGAAVSRFDSAVALLKGQAATDSEQIAAIGYCFGGAVVLSMARLGKDLKGVVSFHGALGGLPPVGEGVKSPALVLNGEADPLVTEEQIAAFKSDMDAAGAQYEFVNYPGAKHAFTNPEADEKGKKFSIPLEYNEAADKDSWLRMEVFLKDVFSS